ncbi:MAG: SpoIIE family protein phosphatase [Desulfobacterales bacterium]|jgi:sigma-B regulation protein RsbU (phosphoserine phosphatase)
MSSNPTPVQSVLLVDDTPENLQMLVHTLRDAGARLLIAKDGTSALTIARKALPDLILLDIMMPDIDGFEVCRQLKSEAATEAIPIIFLSALSDTTDKVRGFNLGAVDYITKPFQPEEVIARVVTHLTLHRLRREVQDHSDQLERELKVVSQIQRELLPAGLPDIPGLSMAVFYETSRYAGGDYFDIVRVSDHRWGILVADAEGHGAPAAVMMAMTCALFRSCDSIHGKPAQLLTTINNHLCRVNDSSFVTAVYGVYDSRDRRLCLARAGHPLPMVYRPSEDRIITLASEGVPPLGWEPYDDVPESRFCLAPGDRLLLYTDGVTERFNPQGTEYGEDRLASRLAGGRGTHPGALTHFITDDLAFFAGGRPADDDQLMVLATVDADPPIQGNLS